jgi:phage recombination protein Bet
MSLTPLTPSAPLALASESPGLPAERFGPLSEKEVQLLKDMLGKDLSDTDFTIYLRIIHRTGLDPFSKQIYAIPRNGKMTIQTGIDGYRLIAARTGELAGIEDSIFDTETNDNPGKATVTVWRFVQGQRVPFTASARWSEYAQPESKTWKKMPYVLLGKCAEALALRKGFPAELSAIYTREEMDQADAIPTRQVDPVTGEVTESPAIRPMRQANRPPATTASSRPAAPPAAPQPSQPSSDTSTLNGAHSAARAAMKERGFSGPQMFKALDFMKDPEIPVDEKIGLANDVLEDVLAGKTTPDTVEAA